MGWNHQLVKPSFREYVRCFSNHQIQSKSRGLTNLDEAPEPKKRQAFAQQHGYGFHLAGKAQARGGGLHSQRMKSTWIAPTSHGEWVQTYLVNICNTKKKTRVQKFQRKNEALLSLFMSSYGRMVVDDSFIIRHIFLVPLGCIFNPWIQQFKRKRRM